MEYSRRANYDAQGKEGELLLATKLQSELEGTGLEVRIASEGDKKAPFDVEVLSGGKILVGIENKALRLSRCTRIDGNAIKRKKDHAKVNRIPKVLTTVTLLDQGQIGFRRGIENKPIASYDFSFPHLIQEILATKREA